MKIFPVSPNNTNVKPANNRKGPLFKGSPIIFNTENILKTLGFSNNDAKTVSENIFKTYSNPQRGYHGIKHIENMLKSFDEFLSESNQGFMIKNTDEFRFAVIMHDYVNGETDEVGKSASKAKEFLHIISDNYDSSYIENLILATDYSKKINLNFDEMLIQDIDLEILGKLLNEYKEYSDAIRLQYACYPDKIFNPARKKVLETFLNKEHIYNMKYYRDKYEFPARENIKQEIINLVK